MIVNLTKQSILAKQHSLADNPLKRMKGLLGRQSLDSDEALIIPASQSVHMVFMAFAIDVVFIDRNNAVIGLCDNLRPFQFSPIFWKSSCAIELPTGTIKRSRTQLGDLIQF